MEESVAVGGKEQRRGAMYQDCSQLLYALIRLLDHPNLEIIVESIEDATILYKVKDENIVELVQCKKREAKESGPAYAGVNDRDPWIEGTFNLSDLQGWIVPVREGVSTASLLEQNENYRYTTLVFGQLTKPLAAFVPEGLKELPLRYPSVSFREGFPVPYRHTKEPVNSPKSRFATEDVRKRIRVISTVSPKELQWMCMIMLTEPELYGVSNHKVDITLNKLLRKFGEAATVKGKISGQEIREIISAGKLEHGLWQKAEAVLDQENPAAADPNRGEPPRWIDFATNRFADRPEFTSTWNEIAMPGGFVAVNGAVGTGKTTLCKFLMHRFLKARVENRAYYLLVSPTTSLSDELNFLTQNIHADTLFVVDDEHLAVAEVAKLVEAFLDFKTSGNARARLVVSSKINYGRAEGLAQGHKAKQLRQAIHIPLPNNSSEIVEQLIGQLRTKAGLTSALSNKELGSLSDGVLGLALLIAQSHPHSTGGQTRDEIVARDKLTTQLAKWISSHVPNVASRAEFEAQLAPIFILSAFGLPVPEFYSPHLAPLQAAGFLEPFSPTTDPHSLRAANLNLAFIIQAQFKLDHFKILSDYIDRHVEYLPQVLVRVAEWKESQQTLEELSKAKFKLISQRISEPFHGLSLSNVTNILRAIRSVSRGTSIRLLAEWISPDGQANKWFFRDVISRATSVSELTGFFGVIYQIDRHLGVLKALAESQYGLMAYERDQILLLFSRQSCQLDQIAVCLHEIKRIASDFAVRMYEHFKTTDVFDQKVAETEANERSLSIWLRYCEELKSVNRSDAYETLEKFLPPDKIIKAALVKSTTLNPISVFLLRLRRVHPRWAAEILSILWKDHQQQMELLLRSENDLDTLTQDLYSFSQVNRSIAIQFSFRILDRIVVLLRAEEQYKIVGAKIETFRKFISSSIASELCESIEKPRVLELIQKERRYADLVGKFLFDLSQASFTTAAWFEERLNYQNLLRITRTPKLRDLAIVVRGFLIAASFERREVLRDQMLNDAGLRSSFRKRWDEANTLSELGFCLVALTSCPFKGDEIERLLNFSNRSAIAADIYKRFADTTNILHIGNGLYGVARFDNRIARQALQVYVDHIVNEVKKSRKIQEGALPGKRGQTSRSALGLNRNNVEQGYLFQISAAVNLNDARRLIELVDPSVFIQMCAEEANLGRLTVFLSGLRQASRHYANDVLAALSSDDQWRKQFDENEEIENIIHYARVVNLVSRPTARQFTSFLFERLGPEIDAFMKIEANVLLISNWLRVLANAGEDYIQEHADTPAQLMIEAVKYDRRIWHLLEGAEALVDTGRIDLAKKLADEILAESRQISSARSLRDLIVLINKAIHVERGAQFPGFTDSLTKSIEDWHISIMISTERQYLLSAYIYYLFNNEPILSRSYLKSAVLNKRTLIIDALDPESPSISKLISLVLCDAPHARIVEVANDIDWAQAQTWELGLSTLVFNALYGPKGVSSPLYSLDSAAKEFLSSGLNRHAGNLEFALSLYLARSLKMPADYLSNLESEAASRAEVESSSAIRWLLHNYDVSLLSKLPYYTWIYLKETLLRPTYLPWEKDIEVIADSIAFKQEYFRDLPSLAGA